MKPFAVSQRRRARQGFLGVFALPLIIFVASVAGLVFGLTGTGLPDVAAWLLLSLPLLAVLVAWRRRGRTYQQRKT
jgi:hypothetical protein